MKYFNRVLIVPAAVLLFAGLAAAQQKPKPAEPGQRIIPLKVAIVLSEYDGSRKISSLPYTLDVNAIEHHDPRWRTHLRLGVRVPIRTSPGKVQYTDIGTNIDCSALSLPDGTFQLNITTERSSVLLAGAGKEMRQLQVPNSPPIMLNFRASNILILRDGQSDEATVATDPFSGHLMRVSVTLHVVKSSS